MLRSHAFHPWGKIFVRWLCDSILIPEGTFISISDLILLDTTDICRYEEITIGSIVRGYCNMLNRDIDVTTNGVVMGPSPIRE